MHDDQDAARIYDRSRIPDSKILKLRAIGCKIRTLFWYKVTTEKKMHHALEVANLTRHPHYRVMLPSNVVAKFFDLAAAIKEVVKVTAQCQALIAAYRQIQATLSVEEAQSEADGGT